MQHLRITYRFWGNSFLADNCLNKLHFPPCSASFPYSSYFSFILSISISLSFSSSWSFLLFKLICNWKYFRSRWANWFFCSFAFFFVHHWDSPRFLCEWSTGFPYNISHSQPFWKYLSLQKYVMAAMSSCRWHWIVTKLQFVVRATAVE